MADRERKDSALLAGGGLAPEAVRSCSTNSVLTAPLRTRRRPARRHGTNGEDRRSRTAARLGDRRTCQKPTRRRREATRRGEGCCRRRSRGRDRPRRLPVVPRTLLAIYDRQRAAGFHRCGTAAGATLGSVPDESTAETLASIAPPSQTTWSGARNARGVSRPYQRVRPVGAIVSSGSAATPSWQGQRAEPTRLVLLRHGQTPVSMRKRRSRGRGNPRLTELGEQQALAAASRIAAEADVAAVVAATRPRTPDCAGHRGPDQQRGDRGCRLHRERLRWLEG